MIHDLFRSFETTLHERLAMMEDILRMRLRDDAAQPQPREDTSSDERIRALEAELAAVNARLATLEMGDGTLSEAAPAVHVHRVGMTGEEIAGPAVSSGDELWIQPMKDLKIELPAVSGATTAAVSGAAVSRAEIPSVAKVVVNTIVEEEEAEEVVEEEEAEEEVVEEEEAEEEVVEEEETEEEVVEEEETEEEVVEEEEAEEEVVEEEETEEEGLEVEQFEYKGKTYFRDGDNQVYAQDADDPEQPDATPIGTWDAARGRVLFRRAS